MPEYVVETQDRVIKTGESPFSVARDVLGPNATESQVAAFAQAQGWDSGFQSGQTINIQGTYVAEGAKPSSAYMAQVRGEADAYNAGTFNPYSSEPAGAQTASYFGGAQDPNRPGYQPFSAGLVGREQSAPLPGSGVKSMSATPPNLAANSAYAPTQFSSGVQRAGQIQGGPIADIGGNADRFGGPNTGPVIPAMNARQTGLFNQIEAGLPTGAMQNTNRQLPPAFQAPQGQASTPRPTGVKAASDTIGVQQPQNVTAMQAQAANYTAIALQEALTAESQGYALEAQQYFPNYVLDSTREIMGITPTQMSSIGYVLSQGAWVPDPNMLITASQTMTPTGTATGGGQSQGYVDWWNYPATGVYPDWMAPNRPRRGGVGFGGSPSFSPPPPNTNPSYGGAITAGWSVNF